jgi:beta-lactamase superfamily II metal-dependent hydrolase
MKNELLVRVYKVGCGDCIFVRVPDKDRPKHILIDCGNYLGESDSSLKAAMANVEEMLKDKDLPNQSKGVIDLLVVSHQHWDHIKGFESVFDTTLANIRVERIWLSTAMSPNNEHAMQLHAMADQVDKTYQRFKNELNMNAEALYLLEMLSLSRGKASSILTDDLPKRFGIEPAYVYRGFEAGLSEERAGKALLKFEDSTTKLSVLAPEKEIDEVYVKGHSLQEEDEPCEEMLGLDFSGDLQIEKIAVPPNISLQEFRNLKEQLRFSSTFAAAKMTNHALNNTSVVLLLEWKGRRLIFPGDAEQKSWSCIWSNVNPALAKPVDFLKIAHHGSRNATPYNLDDPNDTINLVLNSILPRKGKLAKAVVSTRKDVIKADKNPVPYPDLMGELACRVKNTCDYSAKGSEIKGLQPQRTDCEATGWIDVNLKPRSRR